MTFALSFNGNARDLDRLARIFGCSISLLRADKPEDGEEFVKKLLAGVYTGDHSAKARAELRTHLRGALQKKGGDGLEEDVD